MTFESDLVTLLVSDYAIADAIEDQAANERRIYPLERPQGQKNLRALVYTPVFAAPAGNMEHGDGDDAAGDLENVRLQIDVWAATMDAARELARLVQQRMKVGNASIRSVRISRQSVVDPDTRERREILDFSVWHSPQ